MNLGELLSDDDEEDDKTPAERLYARAIYPYPLNTGGPQLLWGRTRRCGFWVSAMVPDGTVVLMDTTQLVQGRDWIHNPAKDEIPGDALLVIISPRYQDSIRKAMGSFNAVPHPAEVAARIIDSECKKDKTLAARINWRVKE